MGPKVGRLQEQSFKSCILQQSGVRESTSTSENISADVDFGKISADTSLKSILEINKDLFVERFLLLLSEKIPRGAFSEYIESDIRSTSVIISGIEEATEDLLPSERQTDVELKVSIRHCQGVQARKVLWMGKPNLLRPLLVKVVHPSKLCWKTALANAKHLRSSGYPQVFIRRSVTAEERKREFDLRKKLGRGTGGNLLENGLGIEAHFRAASVKKARKPSVEHGFIAEQSLHCFLTNACSIRTYMYRLYPYFNPSIRCTVCGYLVPGLS